MTFSLREHKIWTLLLLGLLLCPTTNNSAQGTAEKDSSGFVSLFNGKDLKGWGGATDAFEVKDGNLVCFPDQGGTIYTQERYSDFIVRLEYKTEPGADYGLAIRYPGSGNPAYVGMCKIQISSEQEKNSKKTDPRQLNGSAYGLIPARQGSARPDGEWNQMEVTVEGSAIKVVLNGATILNGDMAEVTDTLGDHPHPGRKRKSGHFGITGSFDAAQFRSIQLKKLK